MSDIAKQIGDIERKLHDGETLLRGVKRASIIGWVFIVIGAAIMLVGDIFFIAIGLLVIAASIWRLYKAKNYRKEIEDGMREYRGRKAELQAQLMTQ